MTNSSGSPEQSQFKPGDLVQMRAADLKLKSFSEMKRGDIGIVLAIEEKKLYNLRRRPRYAFRDDKIETKWYVTVMWREFCKSYIYDGLPSDTIKIDQKRLKRISN